NRISDLTPLSNLTSLGCLELNNNQISDIKPLSTLTQLTRLPLENNQISDLTPLSNLTSLGCLELNNNQIRDIMPLSNLTNLTDLELNNNQISDLTPLSALTQLEFLELNNNQISDLTPLSGLTNLCDLNLDNNPIPNLNLLKALQQQWRNLSTEPITPQPATAAVHSAYATIGLVEPEIIFCTSPYAALVLLSGCESLGVPLAKILSENSSKPLSPGLWHWLRQQMEFQLGEEVETQLYQQLKDDGIEMKSYNNYRMTQGNYIIPEALVELISITEFCISEFGCVLDHKEQEALRCLKQLFLSCGWIFPYEKVCVVCDRPRILCFDNQERLHAEASPAIQYADGWSVYAYHGVRLPEKYGKVHPNQWQSQWLVSEENAELRRVLIQEIGYARLVEKLQAIELDSWQEYTLIGIDFNADEEPIYLLKMTCPSTGYIHALRVPPDMKSAREAISWVNWGVDPEQFSVQT
ncbi:MAG TPA: leucine-rich repeat domain-containing protein, partial [Stenomitos sp.]